MSGATRLSIFPLAGALLFPRSQLPLHVFEPRYRALVSDALVRDRRIGMIQPRAGGERPALYEVGCIGRIGQVEAIEDGRFNLVLDGVSRFRILRELDCTTAFRQVEADVAGFDDADPDPLPAPVRGEVEEEGRAFAAARGYQVDWDAVARIDDEALVNAVSQIAPFDVAAKQGLLEAATLGERADMLVQFLRFYRLSGEGGPAGVPLQ